ncbi:MAG: hypothetical protein R2706_05775 [Acidimicrobiales bacterium]
MVIRTSRGDEMRAKFVALGTGPLHRPKRTASRVSRRSRAISFHQPLGLRNCGGNPSGRKQINLADKRVGIIGTGATSVQCIPTWPGLQEALRLSTNTVVDRCTATTTTSTRNGSALEPGWQDKWLLNFCTADGWLADEDLVMDGWTDIPSASEIACCGAGYARRHGEGIPRRATRRWPRSGLGVDELVHDEATAEALKPWYRQLCKRPCFHDEYLQAYNEPGTYLIDTDGKGVERITETAVVVDGVEYEVDLLIYASGFEVGTDYARRSGFDLVGRNGRRLSEHWADGMLSLHGIHMAGFPNAFLVGPTQGANLISNIPHNMTEAGKTIATIIAHATEIGADEVEVSAEAESAWVDKLEHGGRTFGANPECTPGYYNNEGHDAGRRGLLNRVGYPDGPVAYFAYIDAWRTSGEFAGLTFTTR